MKWLMISLLLSVILLFSSCAFTSKNSEVDYKIKDSIDSNIEYSDDTSTDCNNIKNRKISYKYMDSALDDYASETMRCLTEHDTEGLKSIYTDRSLEELELDAEIQAGFDFINDEITSYG